MSANSEHRKVSTEKLSTAAGSSPQILCQTLGIQRPVLLAPMAKIAGGRLTRAVSDAGGLGVLGGGYGNLEWIRHEMGHVGDTAIGIGLITWNMAPGSVEAVLEAHRPAAVWLSFGDPTPHITTIHSAGAKAICQVGTVDEAVAAADAGADVIVAQGSEAGGHGRPGRALFGLLPAISAAIPNTPLVAAGGISTAAGFNAAHALGAAGVAIGTAFYATREAADVDAAKQRIVESRGDDTVHSVVYDLARGPQWPAGYTGRSIRTAITDTWAGREHELSADQQTELASAHAAAAADNDMSVRVVWAGGGIDAITAVQDAASVVHRFPRADRFSQY